MLLLPLLLFLLLLLRFLRFLARRLGCLLGELLRLTCDFLLTLSELLKLNEVLNFLVVLLHFLLHLLQFFDRFFGSIAGLLHFLHALIGIILQRSIFHVLATLLHFLGSLLELTGEWRVNAFLHVLRQLVDFFLSVGKLLCGFG